MGRQQAILTSLALVAVTSALAADPPRFGPVGPAKAPPPPEPKYGPIGPAQTEGPQGRDMSGIRNFSVEGSILLMLYDRDLHLDDRFGARGRIYFPLTEGIEAALGGTVGPSEDEVDDEEITTGDLHAGAFVRRRWGWGSDQLEGYAGAIAGMFRVNGGDPNDSSPFGGLEGGLRWVPTPELSLGLGYEIMFTGTDANQRGEGSSGILNNYLMLSFRYEF